MSYCSVIDFRAEGITEEQFSDEQLEKLIDTAGAFIESITGQWFEPREKTFRFDGRGGKNLVLPVFASAVDSVKIGHEEIDDYLLYNRMEDRAYPKIFRALGWPRGRLNITVSGTFGYVEEDGSTPLDIKRAAMKLALYGFPALSDSEAQADRNIQGLIVRETTDGHSYELAESAVTSAYSDAITGDSEIDGILKRYMRSRRRMAIV